MSLYDLHNVLLDLARVRVGVMIRVRFGVVVRVRRLVIL